MFDDELAALQPTQADALAEQLRAEQETNLVLQESMADLELALEDRGWYQLQGVSQQEFSRAGLGRAADIARTYAIVNPLIKRGLGLRSAYIWGKGVSIRARSVGDNGTQDVNAVVQAFIDDDSNKVALTSGQAQSKLERALGTDGNVFLACFSNPRTGRVQVRSISFLEVQDAVCNPEDAGDPWFYLREWTTQAVVVNGGSTATVNQTRRAYYAALGYRPASRPRTINGIPVMWDSPVLHVHVNGLDGWRFGIGDAYAALPWARAYKDFLTDWAKLVKSLSRFAWRLSADKSSKAQQAAAKLRGIANTGPLTSNDPAFQPDSMAGATATYGPGANLEAIPKSGATIDSNSGRPLAAMIAAAMAVPVTMMLADPGLTGARAVAETLDRPTELEMISRQSVWHDAFERVLNYVIDQAVKAPQGPLKGTVTRDLDGREQVVLAGDDDRTIDIVFPDMSGMQTLQLVQAVVAADSTGKMPPRETMRLLLESLGVGDVDDILKDFEDDNGEFIPPDAAAAASAGQAAVDAFRKGQDPAAVVGDAAHEAPAA